MKLKKLEHLTSGPVVIMEEGKQQIMPGTALVWQAYANWYVCSMCVCNVSQFNAELRIVVRKNKSVKCCHTCGQTINNKIIKE